MKFEFEFPETEEVFSADAVVETDPAHIENEGESWVRLSVATCGRGVRINLTSAQAKDLACALVEVAKAGV